MPKMYGYAFLVCEAIGIFLGLAIVREIFTNVFSPHPALRKLATVIFRVVVIAFIVLGCGVVYTQSGDARGVGHAILLAEKATRIVEVGLIMFLFLSSSVFGLHWKQNVFGIALGLGMFAAVELINVTLIGHVSTTTAQAFSLGRSISFCASLMMWAGYLLVPEQTASTAEIPKRAQLEQWNQAVMELISR
jgi:Na+-driven multidrug efflux pump